MRISSANLIIIGVILILFGKISGQIALDISYIGFEQKVDSFIQVAMDSQAFPGAQILVAKNGKVVFEKAYGYHTYEKTRVVSTDHLYDLASITKVSTGLPLLMNLIARGKISLDDPIGHYLKEWKKSNKSELTLREILAHQSGLIPYIVYHAKMRNEKGEWMKKTFKGSKKGRYKVYITDEMYMHNGFQKKMSKQIKNTKLGEKEYRYSGLFFQLFPKLIEQFKSQPFSTVLNTELYSPLGISNTLTYLPLEKHDESEIVPTEIDTFFRSQLVHGHVHDEAAAMWGGLSCNAGLFGNARSLARLFQLYLDDGFYNGIRLIDSLTLKTFTQRQYKESDNRRGLGFDKPRLEYDEVLSSVARDASPNSFGHSGFTGTLVWADPDHDLIYIFLSNRVHPYRSHRQIYKMNVRPTIHQWAYDYFVKNEMLKLD